MADTDRKCRKIDPDQRDRVLRAAASGRSADAIAAIEGCKIERVYYLLKQAKAKDAKRQPGAALAQTAPAPPSKAVLNALLDTGGRYADLNAYAAEQGISFQQALQRWHRARLGLPMLGVA